MGRVIREWKQTPSDSPGGVFVYSGYDSAGNLTSLTYPDGRKVTQSFGTSGRLSAVTYDNWNGQHIGYNYASEFEFTPSGALANVTFGNGVHTGANYNSRQQVCQMATSFPASYGSTTQQVAIDKHYYYAQNAGFCAATAGNNGNIAIIADERNPGNTQGFGYDQLNRLTSASRSDGGFNYSYPIDSFGNMTQVNNLTGNPVVSFYSNNQMQVGGNADTYDAAGNLVDTGQYGQHFTYDAESRISGVNQGSAASYTYNLQGQRARKDANGNWTEYFYFGDQILAEKHADGSWSDYIYANGQKLAKADSFDARLHLTGVNCDNSQCGVHSSGAFLPTGSGYVVQNGDQLHFRQYQAGAAQGGLMIGFTNGDITNWSTFDTDGQQLNNDGYKNQWHLRTVDLSAHAGKTISTIILLNEVDSGAGQFDLWVSDISITNTNGNVQSIYNRQQGLSLPLVWGAGVANLGAYSEASNSSADAALPQFTTTYYVSDHLGTAQMEFAGGGWPVWKGEFAPYGQEISPQVTSNHYKFTGKERDAESGLDYFGARYMSSSMGRFMSPDDFTKDTHVADPQSWNLYAYARNNPLRYTDPTGQNATVSTSCSTTNNQTTCNVNISASIAIYAAAGSGISQNQLNAAAGAMQSSINNAWSGSFVQDGTTYNVATQVNVSVAGSADAAMSSGAQNVIGMTSGAINLPDGRTAGAYISPKSFLGALTGAPDTGQMDINNVNNYAKHEFTHMLGTGDNSGAVLSNTNPAMRPGRVTTQDLKWGVQEATRGVNSHYSGGINTPVFSVPPSPNYSNRTTVGAPGAPWQWWK
jgi:RHS repeat-associated protein